MFYVASKSRQMLLRTKQSVRLDELGSVLVQNTLLEYRDREIV